MKSPQKQVITPPQPEKPASTAKPSQSLPTTHSPLPYNIAHAAFGVGCEIYRLQALLECASTSLVVKPAALMDEIRSVASFLSEQLHVLKPHLNPQAITRVREFIQVWFGISEKRAAAKATTKPKGKTKGASKPKSSTATEWEGLAFELNASISGADERVQRWWRVGSAFGMVDVAVQSNPETVLEHLKEAQVKVKQLSLRQDLPRFLQEFGFVNLELDANTVSSKLRQILALNPEPRFQASSVIFEEWDQQMQVAKSATLFALAAREGLCAMAVNQEQPKLANDARDKFMYELRKNGSTLREARESANANPDFGKLESEQAAYRAITAYAERHGCQTPRQKRKKR